MTGTFNVTSRSENANYEYKHEGNAIVVNGNYTKDLASGKIQTINGSCYRMTQEGAAGEYFGNFNGYMRDGSEEVRYSMSEMARRDANKVWDAIDEIEPAILGEDE